VYTLELTDPPGSIYVVDSLAADLTTNRWVAMCIKRN